MYGYIVEVILAQKTVIVKKHSKNKRTIQFPYGVCI